MVTRDRRAIHRARMGNFWRDLVIIVLGVILTVALVRMGMLEALLSATEGQAYIGSFIAGIFFTSIFTLAPAAVALAEIAKFSDPWTVAVWGALGAMLGDLLLFLFIRDVFTEDMSGIFNIERFKRLFTRSHLGFLKWMMPLIGAIIIASPLPDELGLALLGVSKTKTHIVLPIAFAMNFLGILTVAYIAQVVL